MNMGNYMIVASLALDTMATTNQPVGIDHPTVRPANFEPDENPGEPRCPDCGRPLSEH